MGTDRRGFLQVAGLGGLGLILATPAIKLLDVVHSPGTASTAESAEGTKRLAMVIDITKCNDYKVANGGCHDCETACHLWHKVPDLRDIELEEEIKWIWEDKFEKVFEEHLIEDLTEHDASIIDLPVKLMCNQCAKPPCIKYCPTRATWRRDSDGIVLIDMHRCIGCRYCMAGCPYGSRSFNWRDPRKVLDLNDPTQVDPDSVFPTRTKGVVEKCNFCADILELDDNGDPVANHTPKCVEACKAGALIFGDRLNHNSTIYNLLEQHKLDHKVRLSELGTKPNNFYIV